MGSLPLQRQAREKEKKIFKLSKISTHRCWGCARVPGDSSTSGNPCLHITTSGAELLDLSSEEPLIYNSFFSLVWDTLIGF